MNPTSHRPYSGSHDLGGLCAAQACLRLGDNPHGECELTLPDESVATVRGETVEDAQNRAEFIAQAVNGYDEARDCLTTLIETIQQDRLTDQLMTPEFRARCERLLA